MDIQHSISLVLMDTSQSSIIFVDVALTWKHGMCLLLITYLPTHVVSQMIFSDGDDGTPLACAAGKGHVKVVNYLLGHDVDINGGITVSHYVYH